MAAETVNVATGVGIPVAVDTTPEGNAQIIKLAIDTDGSSDLIPTTGGLLVNLGTNNDVTVTGTVAIDDATPVDVAITNASIAVTGTVTANAGTNLNTSLLALESGGNLATAVASLSVLDDWDETDRAKVNPIVGQAGVQGASGAVSANTQRVVLATDVALPAGTNGIGKLTANGGVTIGDVNVISNIPGTAATSLGKAEDAQHTTGDTGVAVWGVRNDADASFGADLDYTPISTDLSGNVNVKGRKDLVRVSVQSGGLTTGATAYTAGDQVGTQFTIAGVARASGGGGMIVGVAIISAADTTGPFDVVFTDSSITVASDNAAYGISDADALKIVGVAQCAANWDLGANRIAQAFNLAIPYVCSGGTSLYAGIICRSGIAATPFAAATDLQLIVYVERN